MLTERLGKALGLATEAHHEQFRKGTKIPYVSHPMGVASIALEYGADEDQAIAALLHDVLEDGGPQYAEIIELNFGKRVLSIVEGCTDGTPDETGQKSEWHIRKKAYLEHLENAADEVLLVSGSDKLHNVRSIVSDLYTIGPAVFDRFTKPRDETLWYYRALAEIFQMRSTPMAKELVATVRLMEDLATKGS